MIISLECQLLIEELKNISSQEEAQKFLAIYQVMLKQRAGPIVPLNATELDRISIKDLVQVAGWDSQELQDKIKQLLKV